MGGFDLLIYTPLQTGLAAEFIEWHFAAITPGSILPQRLELRLKT